MKLVIYGLKMVKELHALSATVKENFRLFEFLQPIIKYVFLPYVTVSLHILLTLLTLVVSSEMRFPTSILQE
jgi:hypothetical protein